MVANTDILCDGYLNKFIVMLPNCVYLYEHIVCRKERNLEMKASQQKQWEME